MTHLMLGMKEVSEGGVLTASSIELVDTNPYDLEVGSVIQYGEPVCCGVIKWIGNLPDETGMFAGVEMVRQTSLLSTSFSLCA